MIVEPDAAVAHNAGCFSVEILKGDLSQADDDLRLYHFDFTEEMDVGAALSFFQRRRPVVLGAAFDNIRNVDVVARQSYAPQGFVQQLSRRADKGHAVLIFHTAGSFADEHEGRRRVAGVSRRAAVAS